MSMFLRSYYDIKPMIPRRIQIALRRFRARVILRNHADVWPIEQKSSMPPKDWKGWPGGKKFALVLTHDTEKAGGVEKCLALMEIEKKYGFRSSFNFVPHDYHVSPALLVRLKEEGFEVGVHGLNHDGNMFRSRAIFDRQSVEINKFLKEWGAVGFRAPSMYHNLDWIRDLDIEYDLSTFDTDPFEPQPDGVKTIFPFLVNGKGTRPGYVELPYTLPQDFLLYIIFREKNIDIWKKKLDWIVQRGGMALLNVHPDYIDFNGVGTAIDEYPVNRYEDFLAYVRTAYDGEYWCALPRDVARFFRSESEKQARARGGK
jgi:peptidoglycan/xylan/chitin deacetylase (PgdA/CDA1 family)